VLDAISACHREAGSRFIVGAGCEIPVDTPPANLRSLGAYAKAHRA
jgi:uroporphyrinogen-III decarboxylase